MPIKFIYEIIITFWVQVKFMFLVSELEARCDLETLIYTTSLYSACSSFRIKTELTFLISHPHSAPRT